LINLVEGKGIYSAFDDYLLLITTEGFLEEKIGNNYAYESPEDAMNGNGPVAENQGVTGAIDSAIENIMLLFNTASSFNDNCAVETDGFKNFLAAALETLMAVGAGAALGAAIGSMIFPGIGTAVGAVLGGIIGWFANEAVGDMLADSNGITGDKYCKIMTAALNDFEINVPVYSYKISSFGDYKPLGGEFSSEEDYAFSAISGESKKYKKVISMIKKAITELKKKGLPEEDFERTKKMLYGRFVRGFEDVTTIANMFVSDFFRGVNAAKYVEAYKEIDKAYVEEVLNKHFDFDKMAVSLVLPQ
jgi:hypothetical protein